MQVKIRQIVNKKDDSLHFLLESETRIYFAEAYARLRQDFVKEKIENFAPSKFVALNSPFNRCFCLFTFKKFRKD